MATNQLFNTLLYSFIAGFSTVGGIYLVLLKENWAKKNNIYLVSFAAGVLLAASFIDILPEAIELTKSALVYTLIFFLVLYLLEQYLMLQVCTEESCERHSFGLIGFFGIGFHSLVDGIAIGVGFSANLTLGLIATLAVILHEVPEGISILSILINTGYERRKAIFYSWIVAMATPFGAIFAYLLLREVTPQILGIFLAVAAGSFLYIAASYLIPETHRQTRRMNLFFVIAGALLIYIATSLIK
jgi:ZIP family zinc transporter/zinc and cadmium transporter